MPPVHLPFHLGSPWARGEFIQSLPGAGVYPAGFLLLSVLLFSRLTVGSGQESSGTESDEGSRVSGARHSRGQLELAGPADMPAPPILASLSLTRVLKDHQARPHRGVPSHWVYWPLCVVVQ